MLKPPHEVTHHGLLDSMMRTLVMGGELPPVIVCGEQAFSGSHRIAAWSALGMEPSVIDILPYHVKLVLKHLDTDLESVRFDLFEQALYELGILI